MTKRNRGVVFIKKKLATEVRISLKEAALRLDTPGNTLRQWLKRGTFPIGKLEKLAELIGCTAEHLTNLGILIARPTRSPVLRGEVNILSLLKSVVESGCQSISGRDLQYLVMRQVELNIPMSPTLVLELLRHRPQLLSDYPPQK